MKREMATPGVMAGLVPAIHVEPRALHDVDARDRPGHDGGERFAQMLLLIAGRRAEHLAVAERPDL
jgi:hypothetical protein